MVSDVIFFVQQLDVTICNNAEKDTFGGGGWRAYYGKRAWDSRSVSLLVGLIIPATSAEAFTELMNELNAQKDMAIAVLQKAANEAV